MPSSPLDVMFFEIRGLRCALPLSVIRSVYPMTGVTPVPLGPAVLRGIAPIGGQILPVLDLDQCFQSGGDLFADASRFPMKDKLLLLEVGPELGKEPVRAALAVEKSVTIGSVDEQYSRPPPTRPSFLAATILDASGPALLLDAERTINYVRESITAVLGT
jgi:chemotaxis signal transduction protein